VRLQLHVKPVAMRLSRLFLVWQLALAACLCHETAALNKFQDVCMGSPDRATGWPGDSAQGRFAGMESKAAQNITCANSTNTQLDIIQAHFTIARKELTTIRKKLGFLTVAAFLLALGRVSTFGSIILVFYWFCI
jgi:hypothetical protein